ncbi:NADP-dependent oxidoreductase domain-containing protein [Aspergillus cavernicola]|uniref:NADP-dependent oxidoreductase domain-containing protein n=1 Tax=Aspergillus cavernicola TaxID=176166 RepID=A0ABR4HVZ3_9EURO
MAAPPAPQPPSLLGYHRILSPLAGIRVSPLCLGTMHFGGQWTRAMGEVTKETAFALLDKFYTAGGNFIDTANFYQGEGSEKWIGEWISERGIRDELVLATKYTMGYRLTGSERIKSNFQGSHSKSLRLSVEASLRKLGTEYLDLLYVHMWDFSTGVEEVMQSLHHVVVSGKVLNLGISDAPAWVVVKCNEYARFHGLTRFSVYQGRWSCSYRDFERDILPMCQSEGLAIAPWGALGRGQFKTAEAFQEEGTRNMGPQEEKHRLMAEKLAEVGERKGVAPASIALAYLLHKAPYVFPVIGCRTVEQLESNIESLAVELTEDEIHEIEDTTEFDLGFPMSFLFETPKQRYRSTMTTRDIWQVTCNTRLETVPKFRPIEPKQGYNQMDRK